MLKETVVLEHGTEAVEKLSDTEKQILLAEESLFGMVVNDAEQMDDAIDGIRRVKALIAVIEDIVEPFRAKAHIHYQGVLSEKKRLLSPLERTVAYLKAQVVSFHERASTELVEATKQLEELPTAASLVKFEDSADQVRETEECVEYREYFSAELENIEDLVEYVVESGRYELILPDYKELNKIARRMGLAFKVPGCRVKRKVTPVVK